MSDEDTIVLLMFIDAYNKAREQHPLHKIALVEPQNSPWQKLWENGDDTSFLSMTGFSRSAFQMLLDLYVARIPPHNANLGGRPNRLDPPARLGLLLFYLGSTLREKHICMLFGVAPSIVRRTIDEMLFYINDSLKNHVDAMVTWPNREQKQKFAAMVQFHHPRVNDV